MSYASLPLAVCINCVYPACFRESTISLFNNKESSTIKIGTVPLLLFLSIESISSIFNPVSGLISDTIFSKSRIIINFLSILITPVENLHLQQLP